MDALILGYSFAAAIAISACVVLLFSKSIDQALNRVIPAEMISAWSRYVKFALFTVTFAGGMRLSDLAEFVMTRAAAAAPPLGAGRGLLEILRSITGSLIAASGTLLAFFAATLAVHASMRVYQSHREEVERAAAHQSRAAARPQMGTEQRQPVGSERHSNAKERQRPEVPEKVS